MNELYDPPPDRTKPVGKFWTVALLAPRFVGLAIIVGLVWTVVIGIPVLLLTALVKWLWTLL